MGETGVPMFVVYAEVGEHPSKRVKTVAAFASEVRAVVYAREANEREGEKKRSAAARRTELDAQGRTLFNDEKSLYYPSVYYVGEATGFGVMPRESDPDNASDGYTGTHPETDEELRSRLYVTLSSETDRERVERLICEAWPRTRHVSFDAWAPGCVRVAVVPSPPRERLVALLSVWMPVGVAWEIEGEGPYR